MGGMGRVVRMTVKEYRLIYLLTYTDINDKLPVLV